GGAGGLLAPEAKGQLVALLTGHIVPGAVTAADLGRAVDRGDGKAELATVGGSNLSFGRDGDAIVVTDAAGGKARLTRVDQLQSNGVVHDVDGVLRSR
ncbi:MAG TPA: fasciclin domain-containing protein, partial [Allosphingosinicella sp.]|nr:fasciclin domain-containing protein [Allosphingosinicella sp.]